MTISAKFDEKRDNLLNVTVTEVIGDESKGTQYNAIFEKGADGKYRICTADFDGISEIFSSTNVDYTFAFDDKSSGSIFNTTESHTDAAASRPASYSE